MGLEIWAGAAERQAGLPARQREGDESGRAAASGADAGGFDRSASAHPELGGENGRASGRIALKEGSRHGRGELVVGCVAGGGRQRGGAPVVVPGPCAHAVLGAANPCVARMDGAVAGLLGPRPPGLFPFLSSEERAIGRTDRPRGFSCRRFRSDSTRHAVIALPVSHSMSVTVGERWLVVDSTSSRVGNGLKFIF